MITVQIIDNTGQIESGISETDVSVSVYEDEIQALNNADGIQPSVILLHYKLRNEQTSEYISLLRGVYSECKIVVLADELSEDVIIDCLLAGAKGYLELKQLNAYGNKLVKVVAAGEAWISRRMIAIVLDQLRA